MWGWEWGFVISNNRFRAGLGGKGPLTSLERAFRLPEQSTFQANQPVQSPRTEHTWDALRTGRSTYMLKYTLDDLFPKDFRDLALV